MSPLVPQLEFRLAQMASSSWLPDPAAAEVRVLSTGTYHTMLLVESSGVRSVARICRKSQWGLGPLEQLQRELAVLHDLVPSRVTPRPLALLDGDPPVLFETFLDGTPFTYDRLSECASAIASCHRQEPDHALTLLETGPPERIMLDDGLSRLDHLERLGQATIGTETLRLAAPFLTERIGEFRWDRLGIVHTDLIHSNILATARGCQIVDWEGARLGPPEWDLAYFLSPVTLRWSPQGSRSMDDRRRREFLDAYSSVADRNPAEVLHGVERLLPYVVFRALCWCVEFAVTTNDVAAVDVLETFTNQEFILDALRKVGAA